MTDMRMQTSQAVLVPAVRDNADVQNRRRPGRLENPSPELIALMRKPSVEAVHNVALYDAPNFVLPDASHDGTEISLVKLGRFAIAFGICAAGWMAAFKLMMMNWG